MFRAIIILCCISIFNIKWRSNNELIAFKLFVMTSFVLHELEAACNSAACYKDSLCRLRLQLHRFLPQFQHQGQYSQIAVVNQGAKILEAHDLIESNLAVNAHKECEGQFLK